MNENLPLEFANNKGADQPAHLCSLISALSIHLLESIVSKLVMGEISAFKLVSRADWFESHFVGNPKDMFCRVKAHISEAFLCICGKYQNLTCWPILLYCLLNLCMLSNFSCLCCRLLNFFKINFLKKLFQQYHQGVKQFGSRSGPTGCRSWSGSKLFVKVISRGQSKRVNEFLFCLLDQAKIRS